MLGESTMWTGLAVGAGCLALATWTILRRPKSRSVPEIPSASENFKTLHKPAPTSHKTNGTAKSGAHEPIRQIGLIQQDEYQAFYIPIMDKVSEYARATGKDAPDTNYYDALYKALRKRRSTIFEFGSSEADQRKRAAWTYALFGALSIRYLVSLLNQFTFRDQSDQTVEPALIPLGTLKGLDRRPIESATSHYQRNILNLHLIDKVLPPAMIRTLSGSGIYPTLVNSVTGHYFQPLNPFYQIIEQVECFLRDGGQFDEQTVFDQTFAKVIDAIEQNVYNKNSLHSTIFEGASYLLVDRSILWELFRAYSVAETAPLGKTAFEIRLCNALGIQDQLESIILYTVLVSATESANTEPVTIELRHMLALPYQKIPLYRPTRELRIGRKVMNRNLHVGDRAIASSEDPKHATSAPQGSDQSRPKEGSKERGSRTSNEEPVAVGDLFAR